LAAEKNVIYLDLVDESGKSAKMGFSRLGNTLRITFNKKTYMIDLKEFWSFIGDLRKACQDGHSYSVGDEVEVTLLRGRDKNLISRAPDGRIIVFPQVFHKYLKPLIGRNIPVKIKRVEDTYYIAVPLNIKVYGAEVDQSLGNNLPYTTKAQKRKKEKESRGSHTRPNQGKRGKARGRKRDKERAFRIAANSINVIERIKRS